MECNRSCLESNNHGVWYATVLCALNQDFSIVEFDMHNWIHAINGIALSTCLYFKITSGSVYFSVACPMLLLGKI